MKMYVPILWASKDASVARKLEPYMKMYVPILWASKDAPVSTKLRAIHEDGHAYTLGKQRCFCSTKAYCRTIHEDGHAYTLSKQRCSCKHESLEPYMKMPILWASKDASVSTKLRTIHEDVYTLGKAKIIVLIELFIERGIEIQ